MKRYNHDHRRPPERAPVALNRSPQILSRLHSGHSASGFCSGGPQAFPNTGTSQFTGHGGYTGHGVSDAVGSSVGNSHTSLCTFSDDSFLDPGSGGSKVVALRSALANMDLISPQGGRECVHDTPGAATPPVAGTSRKRRRCPEDENDEHRLEGKRPARKTADAIAIRMEACPFYLRFPDRFRPDDACTQYFKRGKLKYGSLRHCLACKLTKAGNISNANMFTERSVIGVG